MIPTGNHNSQSQNISTGVKIHQEISLLPVDINKILYKRATTCNIGHEVRYSDTEQNFKWASENIARLIRYTRESRFTAIHFLTCIDIWLVSREYDSMMAALLSCSYSIVWYCSGSHVSCVKCKTIWLGKM